MAVVVGNPVTDTHSLVGDSVTDTHILVGISEFGHLSESDLMRLRCIIEMVRDVNPDRCPADLLRTLHKLGEEMGEADEAYLQVTSARNPRGKTWDDVHEELADTLIMTLDIALTLVSVNELFQNMQGIASMLHNFAALRGQLHRHMGEMMYLVATENSPGDSDTAMVFLAQNAVMTALASCLHPPDGQRMYIVGIETVVKRKVDKWRMQRTNGKDVVRRP